MKDINYYISEKLRIDKDYKSNQEFDNWDEFKEYLESIDIKVTKNSRFWWWLESKEKSIKCLVSPTGDDFFFINSRADTNEGIIYINEYGKWIELPANNYKFDLTVDEEDKPAFKYSSNTANILKKILSGDFNVTEKLHISKNLNIEGDFRVMKEIFDDNKFGYNIIKFNDGFIKCILYTDVNSPNPIYPYIVLNLKEDYWCEWGEEEIDLNDMFLSIWLHDDDVVPVESDKFDLDESNKGYAYNKKNAKILVDMLSRLK